MHTLVVIGVIATAIGFAFGEGVARIFVGGLLAVAALFVLLIAYIAVLDNNRQVAQARLPAVHYGAAK